MSNVRVAIFHSALGKYLLKTLGLINTIIIARLLSPSEVGYYAVASSVVMILSEIRLLGANAYIIREKDLTDEKVRQAFGVTIVMCWGLGAILFCASGSIAEFFNKQQTSDLLRILSASFIFTPLISISSALLSRDFKFYEISKIQIVATLVQIAATVVLVLLEFSYYALAWSMFLSILVQAIMSIRAAKEYKIKFPLFSKFKEIAKLGLYISLANLLIRLPFTASDIVIGKIGTAAEVGIFSRGMGLIEYITRVVFDGINPVVTPYMSRIKRSGESIAVAYTKSTSLLASFLWPMMAVIYTCSENIIILFFGEQWALAATAVSVLTIWVGIRTLKSFYGSTMIAIGKEKIMFYNSLAAVVILFPAIYYLYQYDYNYISWAFVAAGIADLTIALFFLKKCIDINLIKFFLSLSKPTISTLICFSTASIFDHFVTQLNVHPFIYCITLAVIIVPTWILSMIVTNSPLVLEMKNLVGELKKKRK